MVWIPAPAPPRRTVEETTTPELDPATRCSTMRGIVTTRAFSKFLVGFLALTHGVRSLGRRAKNSDPPRLLVVHHLLLHQNAPWIGILGASPRTADAEIGRAHA